MRCLFMGKTRYGDLALKTDRNIEKQYTAIQR